MRSLLQLLPLLPLLLLVPLPLVCRLWLSMTAPPRAAVQQAVLPYIAKHLLHLTSVSISAHRDCWAQRPEDRPSFDAVVGRLRQLLESTPPS